MTPLDARELLDRLRAGDESCEIEAKRGTELGKSVLETVSAFANEPGHGGGYILIGVAKPDGDPPPAYAVVGIADPDHLQAALATQCREVFSLPIRPRIAVEALEGAQVIVVFVPEAQPQEKPVFIKSRGVEHGAFRRVGSTDQRCTDTDIAQFYQERSPHTFDETALEDGTADDLDAGAIKQYYVDRARVNPSAAELAYSDAELLNALGATVQRGDAVRPTIAGLMLFGRESALRRVFPMARVDYIRVEGREWMSDPGGRYQAMEMRGPLLMLIPRVIALVLDDIPKAFALGGDEIHRREMPVVPRSVIREAITNALMHRSYRMRQPVQIIRYSNRLEIRNAGYSLKPPDLLGEPGSIARNERIAATLHEAGLAETKGSGIRVMREAMAAANLTAPLFESDRERDQFTVTLLVHHLLGPEELEWLQALRDCSLTEDEARALVVMHEVGALDNSAYRDINRLDTNAASSHLRRLRDLGLLDQQGRGVGTYYTPGPRLVGLEAWSGAQDEMEVTDESVPASPQASSVQGMLDLPDAGQTPAAPGVGAGSLGHKSGRSLGHKGGKSLGHKGGKSLGHKGGKSLGHKGGKSLGHKGKSLGHTAGRSLGHKGGKSLGHKKSPNPALLLVEIPPELRQQTESLAGRVSSDTLADGVEALCNWRPLTIAELAALTGKSSSHLRKRTVRRLLAEGRIRSANPERPNDPRQRYLGGSARVATAGGTAQ